MAIKPWCAFNLIFLEAQSQISFQLAARKPKISKQGKINSTNIFKLIKINRNADNKFRFVQIFEPKCSFWNCFISGCSAAMLTFGLLRFLAFLTLAALIFPDGVWSASTNLGKAGIESANENLEGKRLFWGGINASAFLLRPLAYACL